MNKLNFIAYSVIAWLLIACSSTKFGYTAQGKLPNSLPTDTNIASQNNFIESSQSKQIAALKNSVYGLFFKQGIFAGQDKLGSVDFKYQRWQVPLVMGSMINVDQNYLGQFHDFLPDLAGQNNLNYANYSKLLDTIYRVNNWNTFTLQEQKKLCKSTMHCLYIDDRLWWVNAFLSYAEGLATNNPQDPNLAKILDYAYNIFVNGITRDEYINEIGTPDAKSVMWSDSIEQPATYKSTISNSLYVTAGARLAKLIKFQYSENNQKYNYTKVLHDTQLVADGYFLKYFSQIESDGLLMDGITTTGLSTKTPQTGTIIKHVFTYNQGVILPGMAILTQLTEENKYLQFAKNLIQASYENSLQHNNFWDDYNYILPNGWFPDGDGIAFRLAYWQYFSIFLENYNLDSDDNFRQIINNFVTNNAQQIVVRDVNLTSYAMPSNIETAMSPNHNNITTLPQGKPYTNYPDGYSLPGTSAALELLTLQQRLQNYSSQTK